MKKTWLPAAIAIVLTIAACGSNFEWFPPVNDTFAPAVSADIANSTKNGRISSIFNNLTTIASLPASVTFNADEATTIYYTTNKTDEPTTASPSVAVTATGSKTVSNLITVTNTVLKFFGIDSKGNQSAILTGTIKSP